MYVSLAHKSVCQIWKRWFILRLIDDFGTLPIPPVLQMFPPDKLVKKPPFPDIDKPASAAFAPLFVLPE